MSSKAPFLLTLLIGHLAFAGVNTKLLTCAAKTKTLLTFSIYCIPGGGLYRSPIKIDEDNQTYRVDGSQNGTEGEYLFGENSCKFQPTDGTASSQLCDLKAYGFFMDGLVRMLTELEGRTKVITKMKSDDGTALSNIIKSQEKYQSWSAAEYKNGVNCHVPDEDAWKKIVETCGSIENLDNYADRQEFKEILRKLKSQADAMTESGTPSGAVIKSSTK